MTSVLSTSGAMNPAWLARTAAPASPMASTATAQRAGAASLRAAHSNPAATPAGYAPSIQKAAALRTRAALNLTPTPSTPTTGPTNKLQPAPQNPGQSTVVGDVDGDGTVSIQDAHALLDYLFNGGTAPRGLAGSDANGDGSVNIADVVRIFQLSAQNAAGQSPSAMTGLPLPQPTVP